MEDQFISSLRYLEAEGVIEIIYDPEFPNDLEMATVRMRTEEEIEAEIQAIINS